MKFKKLGEVADPIRSTTGSAGYDLHYPDIYGEPVVVSPGHDATLHTKLAVEIPEGCVGLLLPRSSGGCAGMRLKNTVGVIDSDYRGEIKLKVVNEGDEVIFIRPGDRFCQLVVVPCLQSEVEIVDDLSETARGEGGFGSTGK